MGDIIKAIGGNIEVVHVILFALGLIAMVAEFFEPGMGIFGGIGIVIMVIDIFVLAKTWEQGFVLLGGLAIIVLLFILLLFVLTSYGLLPKKLILSDSTDNGSGYVAAAEHKVAVGDEGVTVTELRPAGKAKFGETDADVVSEGSFVENGTKVSVISVTGNRIVVKKI